MTTRRTPTSSPFLPGSDRVPQVWAGRARELADADVVASRRLAGVYERGRAYLGELGIGKSVLVNRIAGDAADAGHWVAARVRLVRGEDPVGLVAAVLRRLVAQHGLDARIGQRSTALLGRLEEVRLPGGAGVRTRPSAPEEHRHLVLTDLLVQLGTLARETTSRGLPEGRLVLLRIDEVQNAADLDGLSQLLTALGDALDATTSERDAAGIERERLLPLAVYLSGLPDFSTLATQAGATFARRFRTEELEPLGESDLRAALRPFTAEGWPVLTDDGPSTVHMEAGAVGVIVDRCLGDPFLFQLAGEAAWNAGDGPIITAAEAERGWQGARREVDRYVVTRLDGLSELQLAYLETMAGLPPERRTSAAVAEGMQRSSSRDLGSTAHALDTGHRLIRRRAGRLAFRSRMVEAYLGGAWP